MDINKSVMVGAGALLVGILIGYGMGGSDEDIAEESLARTQALSAKVEEMAGKVDGLDTKIAGIEGAVTQFGAAQTDGLKGIGTQIEGIGASVTGAVDKLGAGVSDTVKGQIDGIREQLAALRAPAAPEAGSDAEAPAAAATPGAGTAVKPGETAVIAPDKLHVFLSSADSEAGTAMVAINGQKLSEVALGEEQEANGCKFTLTGFDGEGGATIDGGC